MIQFPSIFQGYGLEAEYMIVDNDLNVAPQADLLLRNSSNEIVNELELGATAWSNELASHVIEIKNNGPVKSLDSNDGIFQKDIQEINRKLKSHNLKLMPTAMHPLMNPEKEFKIWEYEYSEIYEAYNRIFDCRGHGWSNLQSVHINLAFQGDDELYRLHAITRMILPLISGLTASSPFIEGKKGKYLSNRLDYYSKNQIQIPQISGKIIPESIRTRAEYNTIILDPIYKSIASYDPQAILQFEWLNSRGAIVKFERSSLEIRLMDIQECPFADLQIVQVINFLIQKLDDRNILEEIYNFPIQNLAKILWESAEHGLHYRIEDLNYLKIFGLSKPVRIIDLILRDITIRSFNEDYWKLMSEKGNLAMRILSRTGNDPSAETIRTVYQELCECLQEGVVFQ
ncbi:glutamate-cysteine ligase family protein [Leptospira sp. GIMC2001]|uniref:glutamate-cysteine ligase family protein n=1 Tax=Leptospira sp. GIMC2001 TaxID=1513297 RepID=UPI00234B0308|nr:glutamate-cysteine ligase family protein [Leptospira sp. GIMC2001]WCL49977.1 glutamate-cysteine ligase family protein [Leptospira sp. GIMC2001]